MSGAALLPRSRRLRVLSQLATRYRRVALYQPVRPAHLGRMAPSPHRGCRSRHPGHANAGNAPANSRSTVPDYSRLADEGVALAAGVGVHAYQGTAWTVAGECGHAQGNHHPAIAPYGLFRCRDGHVQLACGSEPLWTRLCAEFGMDPARPDLATNAERVANRDVLIAELEHAFALVDADELLTRLSAAGVPAGRVRQLDEVYAWNQTESQGLKIHVDHPSLGEITLPGPPVRFFALEAGAERELTRTDHAPPPVLNADADTIRRLAASFPSSAAAANPPRSNASTASGS